MAMPSRMYDHKHGRSQLKMSLFCVFMVTLWCSTVGTRTADTKVCFAPQAGTVGWIMCRYSDAQSHVRPHRRASPAQSCPHMGTWLLVQIRSAGTYMSLPAAHILPPSLPARAGKGPSEINYGFPLSSIRPDPTGTPVIRTECA